MSTFVSVGNAHQAFTRLLSAVCDHIHSLPKPVIVQHGHTPFRDARCEAKPFLEMSVFDSLISRSQLVILHAGGGGILQALKSCKVPVIAARRPEFGEHIDDHQVTWSRGLAATHRVVLLDPFEDLSAAAVRAMEMQAGVKASFVRAPLVDLVQDALTRARI